MGDFLLIFLGLRSDGGELDHGLVLGNATRSVHIDGFAGVNTVH